MNESAKMRWAFAVFPLAGMAAALTTIRTQIDLRHNRDLLGGGMFGVSLAGAFWLFLGLRSFWKTAVFIVASIAAAYLAALSAILATGRLFSPGPPWEPVCLVGGLVGAPLIVIAALLLLSPHPRAWAVLVRGAFSSLAGGLLGIVGYASGDFFGSIRSRLPFMPLGQTNADISLILIWQTGMGLVLALALWSEKRRLQTDTAGQPH